ncbi:182 kDa tankyrase-1-binding protein-like [Lepisosteus oculatus]|uniref:182 kDa tankyrase-1-binding protein-like n=1 Tax=Lepisosteus oculatus TaxID=7918 RepID=UPI003720688A
MSRPDTLSVVQAMLLRVSFRELSWTSPRDSQQQVGQLSVAPLREERTGVAAEGNPGIPSAPERQLGRTLHPLLEKMPHTFPLPIRAESHNDLVAKKAEPSASTGVQAPPTQEGQRGGDLGHSRDSSSFETLIPGLDFHAKIFTGSENTRLCSGSQSCPTGVSGFGPEALESSQSQDGVLHEVLIMSSPRDRPEGQCDILNTSSGESFQERSVREPVEAYWATETEQSNIPKEELQPLDFSCIQSAEVLNSSPWVERARLNRRRAHRPAGFREKDDDAYWMYRDTTAPVFEIETSDEEMSEDEDKMTQWRKGILYKIRRSRLLAHIPTDTSRSSSTQQQDTARAGHTDILPKKRKIMNPIQTSRSPVKSALLPRREKGSSSHCPKWIQVQKQKRKRKP